MNLDHLRTFLTAAKYLNFSKAGKILNLSQPSVSHHIHQLENYFDKKLFHRTNRKITLTEAGKLLFEHGHALLQTNEILNDTMKGHNSKELLKIGCSFTIGETILTDIIYRFLESSPQLSLEQIKVNIDTSINITEQLYLNKIDLALVEGQESRYNFVSDIFYKDQLVLGFKFVQNVDLNKFDLAYLENQVWIIREPGCSIREAVIDYWNAVGISPKKIIEYNSHSLIKESVKNGLGMSIFSKLAISSEIDDKQLLSLDFLDRSRYRPFYLLRNHAVYKTNLQKNFWHATLDYDPTLT